MSDQRKPFTASTERGSRTSASSEPDLSVADFNVEPGESGEREPAAPVQESAGSRAGLGVGRWLLLWLVITLGVTAGNLLSRWITDLAIGTPLVSEHSEAGNAPATEAQRADDNVDGEESQSDTVQ